MLEAVEDLLKEATAEEEEEKIKGGRRDLTDQTLQGRDDIDDGGDPQFPPSRTGADAESLRMLLKQVA